MPAASTPTLDRLKEQLAQLDALIAQGVLQGEAARTARGELESQVLAAVLGSAPAQAPPGGAAGAAPVAPTAPAAPRPSGRLLSGVAAFVLACGGLGYAWLGTPAALGVGPGDRPAAVADAMANAQTEVPSTAEQRAQIDAMVGKLTARLKEQPDDPAGWSMLARVYTVQGRITEALPAFKKVADLRPQDAQALADYADGLAMVNNQSLEGEPEKLIARALKLDPANVKALSLSGTVAFNRADYASAVAQWESAVQHAGADGDFARQLQGAIAEARQRAGLPAAAVAAAPAAPAARSAAAAASAGAGGPGSTGGSVDGSAKGSTTGSTAGSTTGSVRGRVSLSAAARGQAAPDDTVFIFARAPSGSKMPLAILRKQVRDLPLDFTLDDSQAMSPAARLSSAGTVVVGARVSKSGSAMPGPGDWQGFSAPVAVGTQGLVVEIAEPVR